MLDLGKRISFCQNPTALRLFQIMERKKTNLSVSLDVTEKAKLLSLANALGPYICVLKTHIDILEDFDVETADALTALANQHNFLIFEDRKFADIGNTAMLQYGKGIYHIADWAHITNAHSLLGNGAVEGLKKIGLSKGNGLLLIGELSAKDNLITPQYTEQTVALALRHKDFVMGFISRRKLTEDPAMIYFTPGVHLHNKGDALGQQYITPEQAIRNGADVIIVGRGIYESENPAATAEKYREISWNLYTQNF